MFCLVLIFLVMWNDRKKCTFPSLGVALQPVSLRRIRELSAGQLCCSGVSLSGRTVRALQHSPHDGQQTEASEDADFRALAVQGRLPFIGSLWVFVPPTITVQFGRATHPSVKLMLLKLISLLVHFMFSFTKGLWWLVAEVLEKKKMQQVGDNFQPCGFSFRCFCLMPPCSKKRTLGCLLLSSEQSN